VDGTKEQVEETSKMDVYIKIPKSAQHSIMTKEDVEEVLDMYEEMKKSVLLLYAADET